VPKHDGLKKLKGCIERKNLLSQNMYHLYYEKSYKPSILNREITKVSMM